MHISYYLAAWDIFNFLEISWLAIGPLSNPLHFGKPQEPQVLNCQAATGLRVANSKQNSINAKTLCQPKDSAPASFPPPPPAWVVPLRISNVSNISRKLGCLLSVCLADHFGYLRFLRGRQWQCPRAWEGGAVYRLAVCLWPQNFVYRSNWTLCNQLLIGAKNFTIYVPHTLKLTHSRNDAAAAAAALMTSICPELLFWHAAIII